MIIIIQNSESFVFQILRNVEYSQSYQIKFKSFFRYLQFLSKIFFSEYFDLHQQIDSINISYNAIELSVHIL